MRKKIILCFSCIISIILISGCSMGNTPTKKVEMFLDNYKNQDETVINQLNDMVSTDNLMDDNQKQNYINIMKKQYKDLTYKIKDEKIDGDKATVTAEIEVYDYYKINKETEDYYNNNKNNMNTKPTISEDNNIENAAEDTKNKAEDVKDDIKNAGENAIEGAKNIAEDAKDGVENGLNYIEYRLNKLKETKDRITYTIDFTLTKKNDIWTLDDIDDTTRQKIHGLYEH